MARPERKNVDYFPHYISHGSKMQYLHNKFGNDGYAVWYKMMEKLAKADNHFIDLSDEINLELFADYCLVDIDALNSIINFLCRCNWMHKKLWNDHKVVYSPEFLESVKDAYKRRSNVCINTQGVELMYYNNPQGTELMGDINTQSKVEYSKEDKIKEEKIKQNNINTIYNLFVDDVKSGGFQMKIESLYMRLRLKPNALTPLLKDFKNHITEDGVAHKNTEDFFKHFKSWLNVLDSNQKLNSYKK